MYGSCPSPKLLPGPGPPPGHLASRVTRATHEDKGMSALQNSRGWQEGRSGGENGSPAPAQLPSSPALSPPLQAHSPSSGEPQTGKVEARK